MSFSFTSTCVFLFFSLRFFFHVFKPIYRFASVLKTRKKPQKEEGHKYVWYIHICISIPVCTHEPETTHTHIFMHKKHWSHWSDETVSSNFLFFRKTKHLQINVRMTNYNQSTLEKTMSERQIADFVSLFSHSMSDIAIGPSFASLMSTVWE